MKCIFILSLVGLMHIHANILGQQISLSLQNATVKQALKEIEKQCDFVFMYDFTKIDVNKAISIRANNETVESVLKQITHETDSWYEIIDRQIVLIPRQKLSAEMMLQGIAITGIVTDETGAPVPGVNVVIKGTTTGVVTGMNGEYSINVPDRDAVLVFSFVGYVMQEIAVGDQRVLNITLTEDTRQIEEVVVVGYGTVKKSDLTGSVSSVKTTELQQTPITSIDQGLVGRASGVQVTQTSGMPGAIASIRVRGSSSLYGGNEPLYVIDGFPVYSGEGMGDTGGKTKLSGLSTVNPSDIESIEILKDASATAIYGSRAANGVVLITTKSGKSGHNTITLDSYVGIQKVAKKIGVMDAQQYALLVNEAYTNDGLTPIYKDMDAIKALGKGTDWQDEIFRAAPVQSYQLTVAGGDDRTRYSVSGSYLNQQGVIVNSGFDRFSGRINLDRNIMKNIRIGTHITASRFTSNTTPTDLGGENGGAVSAALRFNPILPVYSNPALGTYTQVNAPGVLVPNPVASAKELLRKSKTTRVLGDIYGEWEIVPNLVAKVMVGVDLVDTKDDNYTPSYIYQGSGIASAIISSGYTTNWINENTLRWSKDFDDHSVSLLGGVTFQQNLYESVTAKSQKFVNDVLKENNMGAATTYQQPGSSQTVWGLISYLGRANYSLKHRYLFSVTGRVDGSSRFGTNNKWAFFPSGSFAWRVSEEEFMSGIEKITNLKARVSYGVTGNQEIGLYSSLPTLTNNSYTIGKALATGFYPNKIPNPDLKWERSGQFDVGLDIGLFSNRLRLTTDYYYKKTTDLIYESAISYTSGFATILQNIGSVENRGFELAVESDNFVGGFRWTTSFNISFNRNKVLSLGGEQYKDTGDSDDHLKTNSIHRLIVDKPVGVFYGYRFDGIFQTSDEVTAGPKGPTNGVGLRRYKDIGSEKGGQDGSVDATYDRTIIGDPNPDFYGGMANTFFYKGFECNIFLQYSYGNDIFNYNAVELELPSGGQNVYADLVNRWNGPGTSNKYPKATTNRSAVVSDAYIEDGSYLKLKTLTLAYTFPWLKAKHIGGLRIYITAQNLWTLTNYRGYDPEVSYRGASTLQIGEDFGGYPQAKTFLFGVKLDIK